MNKKDSYLLFIIASITLLLFVIFVIAFILLNRQQEQQPVPTESPSQKSTPIERPVRIKDIPTVPSANGGSLNISSAPVQGSAREVEKLYPFLPFTRDLTVSNGTEVTIVIPERELQDDPWKLTVQIFGINYQVTEQEESYATTKQAFIEAANVVFAWMSQQGANPSKVIIKWGDRAFIQERAEQWLMTP